MDNFQFWTNWGTGLSDKDFANAFTALGILAARARSARSSGPRITAPEHDEAILSMVYESLKAVMHYQQDPEKGPLSLPWQFPKQQESIILGFYEIRLSNLDPARLASTWQLIADSINSYWPLPKMRLKVLNSPFGGAIRPWYRMLAESAPAESFEPSDKSVCIDMKFAFPEIHMQWPVRFGFLPGNTAGEIVKAARIKWPSNENSVGAGIGRENDNCDILVYDGTLANLIREVKALPVPMKCNLFILRGPAEDHLSDFWRNILELTIKTRSNGLVLCRESMNDADFVERLNEIINQLSHNLHPDICLSRAFTKPLNSVTDPLIILGNALADFRLEHQMDSMIENVIKMPAMAKIEIPPETLKRLNMGSEETVMRPAQLKEMLTSRRDDIHYMAESAGATGLSEINEMLATAELPEEVHTARRERYISSRAYLQKEGAFVEERRALLKGIPAKFLVWIGPREEGAAQDPVPFHVEKLPPRTEAWGLTVVLSEPNHMPKPIVRKIALPQDDKSSECEFPFTPQEAVGFEGRITVLHRGRVIQTAILRMPVVEKSEDMPAGEKLRIGDIIPVKTGLGNIKNNSQFDLAIVMNKNDAGQPLMNMYGKDDAWLANLEGVGDIMQSINGLLSRVAENVEDYKDGLKSDKGLELFKQLIYKGRELYDKLITVRLHTETDKSEFLKKEYFQIITTNGSEEIVPFEFIYEHDAPGPKAKLCGHWEAALSGDFDCAASCNVKFRETICPLGFWGLSKIIERQSLTSEEFRVDRPAYVIRTEAGDDQNPLAFGTRCLVAASANVESKDLKKAVKNIGKTLGAPPLQAKSWSEWETIVQDQGPLLLIAMPHHEEVDPATLEINSDTTIGVWIYNTYVKKAGQKEPPIVALLGCDTVGTALQYGTFIEKFQINGAAIVIGTVATVFGKHATTVADMLVKGLKAGSEKEEHNRMGEVMRSMKRRAMLDGLLMALCVVAFGDADWKLTKQT